MTAPKGNQFWKLGPQNGRKPIWDDPEELRAACEEYFEYVVENPLQEAKAFAYEGVAFNHDVTKMRTMSIEGLCVFLGIVRNTWKNYAAKEEFLTVCEYVDQVMYDYKLTGASAGLLNPSIIQRDLGLVDKKENDIKSGGQRIKNNWHIHPVTTEKNDPGK